MILIDFLARCKKLVDENPAALHMEMFAEQGASGAIDEICSPYINKVSQWDDSEIPIREMLPKDYPYDSIIRVCTRN